MSNVDQAQKVLFTEVFIPAFVEQYNTKAAACNLPPIETEAQLERALGLVEYIKTASAAVTANQVNPIDAAFAKLASASNEVNKASQFAAYASQNPRIQAAIQALRA